MHAYVKPTNFTNGFLTINLSAIEHNYKAIQKYVGPHVEVCSTVKTDAYGLGIHQIAPVLYQAGCRHFFVVHLDEAITLRGLLKDAYIYALAGVRPGIEDHFEEYDIIPVLNCIDQIEVWARFAKTKERKMKAALHFDTGLNRYAIPQYEWDKLEQNKDYLDALDIVQVLSHLACADDPTHPKNLEQLQIFKTIQQKWPQSKFYSVAASYGMVLGSDFHFNAIRPGKALFNPEPGLEALNLQNSTFLYAPILQIKNIPSHATVGYGATFEAHKPARIATVGIGYGDGYPRALSNTGILHTHGKPAPIVGRVSMDFITLDVSDFGENEIKVGDYVEFFGNSQSLHSVAKKIGTISYELLTHLGKRYHRFYAKI
jgi:alanine racemase